jgi:hypothetical protein
MSARGCYPVVDAVCIGGEGIADSLFGGRTIGVGGSGGDVLVLKSLAEFVVSASDVA